MKIACLNLQNNSDNRNNNNNPKIVSDFINNSDYDIIGTQELTKSFIGKMNKFLNSYSIYGSSRYGNSIFSKKIRTVNNYNETTSIITKLNVVKTKTYRLPWLFFKLDEFKIDLLRSINPRTLTLCFIDNNICIINTHLNYRPKSIQIKQLKFIIKLVKKYYKKYHIIITGDFNLECKRDIFSTFIENLYEYGISRVPINDKTNGEKYRAKTAIDHIFISNSFNILDYGTIDNELLNNITDHKGIYVEINIK